MTEKSANPGWYPDPRDPSRDRYWDGSKWTEQTRKRQGSGSRGIDPRGIVASYQRLPLWAQIVIPIVAAVFVFSLVSGLNESDNSTEGQGGTQTQGGSETQEDAASVNKNSRAYIEAVRRCQTIVGVLVLDIQREKRNTLELAEETTGARDTCDAVRSELLEIETEHFDEEASTAWLGVDEIKSGLNALLTWIDNPEPTKLIEARDKLQEGMAVATLGVREINERRHVYGLPPVRS